MRVKLRDEGRIFSGTAKEIVQSMKQTAEFAAHLSLDEYVAWCTRSISPGAGEETAGGVDLEEMCASLVRRMIEEGFAERL